MLERCLGTHRVLRIHRAIRQGKLTLLCLFMTVVVLRGIIGAGKFGTPEQDFNELRDRFYASRKHAEPHRVLVEAQPAAESTQNNNNNNNDPNNYATFDINKILVDEGQDEKPDPNKPYSLGPKISDWDVQRAEWLRKNPNFPNFIGPNKPRVLLVTGSSPKPCENPVGDHYLLKSIKNKIDYCRLHGVEIFYNMALLDAEMAGFWAKLPLIRKLLLSHPEIEFLWWMDSDAMFTDMAFEVPWERYKDSNFVMHGWNEMVYDQKNWIGLNTGSFLLRNCQWALDILDAWAPMGPKGKIREEAGKVLTRELKDRPVFEADDQSAMVFLLATQRDKWGAKLFKLGPDRSVCIYEGSASDISKEAGAKHVYAVEASEMAEYARRLIAGNPSLVIKGKVEEVELPEKADILISEPMGTLLVNERMLESYVIARDRFLLPNGKMFPTVGRMHMAPFSDEYLFIEIANKALFWQQQNYYGVDLTPLYGSAFQGYFSQPVVDAFDPRLLVAPAIFHVIDFTEIKEEELYEIDIPLKFIASVGTRVHGLACWFDVLFNGSTVQRWLTTAPGAPTTHWYQLRCVLSQPLYVMAGQEITGRLRMVAHNAQSYTIYLTLSAKMWGPGAEQGGILQTSSCKLDLKEPYYRMSQPQAYAMAQDQQPHQLIHAQVNNTELSVIFQDVHIQSEDLEEPELIQPPSQNLEAQL
ncbi:hypothetical protein GH714_029250 [Hevea brasiliensis]|uniref:Protein arginine N-methyltransferase domain-containing protein n=1 Tax=Hevea brasiliensis TaxID=3981 RepID=A0A6A6KJQ2_HEVBR|nr:hypothetical protein GH714_029250 [Hevea brasiliensis]